MSNFTKTTVVTTIANSGRTLYLVQLSEENTTPIRVRHQTTNNMRIRSSEPVTYRTPLLFHEEVSAEEWKRSLTYDETQIKKLMIEILFDFGIEYTDDYLSLLKRMINDMISFYETKQKTQLPSEARIMAFNLMLRMVYDKVCLKAP